MTSPTHTREVQDTTPTHRLQTVPHTHECTPFRYISISIYTKAIYLYSKAIWGLVYADAVPF